MSSLVSIWANISETVQAMTNVPMKHVYKVIYIVFQFTLRPLTSNKVYISFNRLYLINGNCVIKVCMEHKVTYKVNI